MTTTMQPPVKSRARPTHRASSAKLGDQSESDIPSCSYGVDGSGLRAKFRPHRPVSTLKRDTDCSAEDSDPGSCPHSSDSDFQPHVWVQQGTQERLSRTQADGAAADSRHPELKRVLSTPAALFPSAQSENPTRTQVSAKSAKRRAAEALLAARFSAQHAISSSPFLPAAASYSCLPAHAGDAAPELHPPSCSSAPASPSEDLGPAASELAFPSDGLLGPRCHAPDPSCGRRTSGPAQLGSRRGIASADATSNRVWSNSMQPGSANTGSHVHTQPETDSDASDRRASIGRAPESKKASSHLAGLTAASLVGRAAVSCHGGPTEPPWPVALAAAVRQHVNPPSRFGDLGSMPLSIQQSRTAKQAAHPRPGVQQPAAKRPRANLSDAATSILGPPPQQQLPMTVVPPCDLARGCKDKMAAMAAKKAAAARPKPAAAWAPAGEGSAGAVAGGSAGGFSWCGFEVKLPSLNWQTVFDEPPSSMQRTTLAGGYEKLTLPEGLVAYVVENPKHVEDALAKLRAAMQDRVIAIDLEWRPETVAGRISPVAVIQLSAATVCLVLRISAMGYALPPAAAAFLVDPSLVLLGFAWDSADEAKMRSTFGLGRSTFRRFLDLQEVATALGYHSYGLARLAQQVLGVPLQKSKAVSRSNWAAPQLTNHQLKYACLDVLVAGHLFRALRLWHSSPSPCASCRSHIGDMLQPGPLACGDRSCKTRAWTAQQHQSHCAQTGHRARYGVCGACGRMCELAAAAGTVSTESAAAAEDGGEAGVTAAGELERILGGGDSQGDLDEER